MVGLGGERGAMSAASSEKAIDVQGLSYAYPGGQLALDAITFSLSPGESVGLVGPNGAGKTSLFLCLTGVLSPRAGSVRVRGLDVRNPAQRKQLPEHVGIVFQNSDDQLFNSTVLDDVAFGPLNLGLSPEEVRQRVGEALGRVGMSGQENRVPLHLSGGEKRRIALAGVLAMRPEVLLLDEPSMFLDPRGRRDLIDLFTGLGGTKLIASHDLDLIVRCCSRVVVLDHGRIVAEGETRAVLGDGALMEAHGLEVPWALRVYSPDTRT
jgi:cobalt/nickel transport system ATP-binding protein